MFSCFLMSVVALPISVLITASVASEKNPHNVVVTSSMVFVAVKVFLLNKYCPLHVFLPDQFYYCLDRYNFVVTGQLTKLAMVCFQIFFGFLCVFVCSPTFYTSRYGYRMCTRLYLNGDGMGKGTHLSLFFVIVRGKYDAILPWPFKQKVTMMLLDQAFDKPVIDAFRPDHTSSSFKRPTSLMNIASGCPLFMPLADFNEGGYIKDDQIFIKIIVDCSDLNAP